MSNRALTILFIVLWIGAYSIDQRWGSPATKKERDYPKPEYVQYPKLTDVQLMYLARRRCRLNEDQPTSGKLWLPEKLVEG